MTYINTKPRRRPRMNPRPDGPVRCEGHLAWIRKRTCCVANADFGPKAIVCDGGRSDPHHVKTRGAGGDDSQVVPLCRAHHSQIDSWNCGTQTFEAIYKVELLTLAGEYWRLSPAGMKHRMAREDR